MDAARAALKVFIWPILGDFEIPLGPKNTLFVFGLQSGCFVSLGAGVLVIPLLAGPVRTTLGLGAVLPGLLLWYALASGFKQFVLVRPQGITWVATWMIVPLRHREFPIDVRISREVDWDAAGEWVEIGNGVQIHPYETRRVNTLFDKILDAVYRARKDP